MRLGVGGEVEEIVPCLERLHLQSNDQENAGSGFISIGDDNTKDKRFYPSSLQEDRNPAPAL